MQAVGRRLFNRVICHLLRHTTRVLVTHQLQYLKHSDVDRVAIMHR